MAQDGSAQIHLEWQGPFLWFENGNRSIFSGPCAETVGIYVWTVPTNGAQRVFYVGQTEKGFAARHLDHFQKYFAGAYSIYEPEAFSAGHLEKIYHGYAYRKPEWRHAAEFYKRFGDLMER